MLKKYQDNFDQRCKELQAAFDSAAQSFEADAEENGEENNTDQNTVNGINGNSPANGDIANNPANGDSRNVDTVDSPTSPAVSPVDNGPVEKSPPRGPHVSTIIVNGSGSPISITTGGKVDSPQAGDGQNGSDE